MQIITVITTILAVSLAAPSEVETIRRKIIEVPVKSTELKSEELVEKDVELSSHSPQSNDDKVLDKVEESVAVIAAEEKEPVILVAASAAAVEGEEKKGKSNDNDKNEDDDDKEKIISAEEKKKKHIENSAICRASTGATEEQINAVKKQVDDAPKTVKCYIRCLAEKYGVEKGEHLQKDVAKYHRPSSVTAEEFEKIAETCGSLETADDPCESAYLRYSCFFRNSGEKIRIA